MVNSKSYEEDVARLRNEDKLKRHLVKDYWQHLRPYTTDLIGWARAGASKRMAYRLLIKKHPHVKDVSPDIVYRFVCSVIGKWPRPHKKHKGEN